MLISVESSEAAATVMDAVIFDHASPTNLNVLMIFRFLRVFRFAVNSDCQCHLQTICSCGDSTSYTTGEGPPLSNERYPLSVLKRKAEGSTP